MKIINALIAVNILLCNIGYAQVFEYGEPEEKTFALTLSVKYFESSYLLDDSLQLLGQRLKFNRGPDSEVVDMLSAIALDDYDRWLDIWDFDSRELWSDGERGRQYFSDIKFDLAGRTLSEVIKLTRWIEMGQNIFVGYEFIGNGEASNEVLIPFRIEQGRWKASKEIMEANLFQELFSIEEGLNE